MEIRVLKNNKEMNNIINLGWVSNDIVLNTEQLEALQEGKPLCVFKGESTIILRLNNEDIAERERQKDLEMERLIAQAEDKIIYGY